MVNEVSGNKGSQNTQSSDRSYEAQQRALAKQIKPQAENLTDLKNAKRIKEQQIALANQHGDNQLANVLQEELNRINSDIARNESIF